MRLFLLVLGFLLAVVLAAPVWAVLPQGELDARNTHAMASVDVESVVVDDNGRGIANLLVRALNAQGDVERATAITDFNGYFMLRGLARENLMLEIQAAGFRTTFVYVQLALPSVVPGLTMDPIVLDPDVADEVRFLFAGDTAWARRFYDTDIDGTAKLFDIPPSDPEAIIDTADPLPGTRTTTQFVKPFFADADFTSLNLETPALTSMPFTPHPEKDFAFFSLPESLAVLPEIGVDYVALGNNHLYDYLELGITDTRAALSNFAPGVDFSGAGSNEAQAIAAHPFAIKGYAYSMLSGTSITGSANEFTSDSLLYIARDSLAKGGAADLTRNPFYDQVTLESMASRIPIAQLHTGDEYTFEPTVIARRRMTDAMDAGARIGISHHPHVAQGFEFYGPGQDLIAHSLGNFVFDQQRLETMHGLTAQLDYAGGEFRRGQVNGVYLEDFRPRPISGGQAATFLRRINEFSFNALVLPYNGRGRLQRDAQQTVQRDYAVTQSVQIGSNGWVVVDLRNLVDPMLGALPVEASLVSFGSNTDINVRLGRDIMERHGEFEDWDVDDDGLGIPASLDSNSYGSRWDWESSVEAKFMCFDQPHRGMLAGCSTRQSTSTSDTVIAFRNRIRVLRAETVEPVIPNLDLTLFGYARGDNAGEMRAEVKYYPSRDELVSFIPMDGSPNAAVVMAGGTFDWTEFSMDLVLPPDNPADYPDISDPQVSLRDLKIYMRTQTARALRVFLDHSPPAAGDGLAAFDDLAVINWEPPIATMAQNGSAVKWPHPLQFMRVEGNPGENVSLTLNFSRLIPEAVKDIDVSVARDQLYFDGFEG